MIFLTVFSAALFAALLLTPLTRKLSRAWGIVAVPGGRRQHEGLIPKLGGLPLFLAFVIGMGLALMLLPPNQRDTQLLMGVFLGSVVVFAGGIFDDWWDLHPWVQLGIQLVGTAVAIYFEVFLEVFTNPLSGNEIHIPRLLIAFVTFIWIAGMMNTINWLDGLDGLAVGVGTIAAVIFAWHSYNLGQHTVALIPLALAGALVGFLPYNFAPATIFLGSAGAYFLGYALATLAILAPAKIATALLVMAVPIMDVAWQIFDRLRRGRSPYHGDRGHLHFRLSDGGLPTQLIVACYYLVALVFGLVAIFATGLMKLVMLVVLGVLVLGLLYWLSRQQVARRG